MPTGPSRQLATFDNPSPDRHDFEQVTNQILDDLVEAVRPRRMTVIGRFNVRGGIATQVVARHPQERRRRPG